MNKKLLLIILVLSLASFIIASQVFAATFGVESQGALSCGLSSTNVDAKSNTMSALSEAGTISKLTAFVHSNDGTGLKTVGVIYSESPANTADALLATSNEVILTNTSGQWTDYTFASPPVLSAGNYFLGIHGESTSASVGVRLACDNIDSSINVFNTDEYDDGASDPFGTPSTSVNEKSIYATYTATATSTRLEVSQGKIEVSNGKLEI